MKKVLINFLVAVLLIAIIPLGNSGYVARAYYESGYSYTVSKGEAIITAADESLSGNITIPSTLGGFKVTTLDNGAFEYHSGVETVTFPDSVTTIGDAVFFGCENLKSVIFSKGVAEIGNVAFSDCQKLKSITVSDDNNSFCSVDGVLFNKDKTELVRFPADKATTYVIPEGVTSIGEGAFFYCSRLTSVEIPNSVTKISDQAFSYCSRIKNIAFPDNVTSVGSDAVYSTAYYNNNANWENDVLYVGRHLVDSRENISGMCFVKEGTVTIAARAFYEREGLTAITLPNSIKAIVGNTFWRCTNLSAVYYKGNEEEWEKVDVHLSDLVKITPILTCVGDLLAGDINNDGEILLTDVVTLSQIVAGWKNVECNLYALDVNGSGGVDLEDITRLSQYIAGWQGIILY